MPNCAIYVLAPISNPNEEQQNRFNLANGNYAFDVQWITSDSNGSWGRTTTPELPWTSSSQQVDNAIMDAVIAIAKTEANVTITRSDCQVFR